MEMQKHLSVTEWSNRSVQLREAYCPWLRERHPRGTVVMINLLTAEYLTGRDATTLMAEFTAKFGDADWYIDMVHPVAVRRRPR